MLGFELARYSIIAPSSLCNGRHWIEPSKTTWSQTLDLSLYSLTFQVTYYCMHVSIAEAQRTFGHSERIFCMHHTKLTVWQCRQRNIKQHVLNNMAARFVFLHVNICVHSCLQLLGLSCKQRQEMCKRDILIERGAVTML